MMLLEAGEATGTAFTAVTNSLVTGITSIASGMTTAVAGVVPKALPIVGAVLVVSIGLKVFKKITGR